MCELFAMASRVPANVSLSLEEFSRHGGLTGQHKDGWGIVYYHGYRVQAIKEPYPACDSDRMRFVKNSKRESTLVISHIRKATLGKPSLDNTQPFNRELSGRMHTFAHNGMMPDIFKQHTRSLTHYNPIGETDSEYAFCLLMERIEKLWKSTAQEPSLEERLTVVRNFADIIRPLGPSNFIYSDGDFIFCHGDKRKHPEGMMPPGLFSLSRSCTSKPKPIHVRGLSITTQARSQDIALVASVPLTEEDWQPLQQGEILVLGKGLIVERQKAL